MNSMSQSPKVGVRRAGNDPRVCPLLVVQANEMLPIERQQRATLRMRECENRFVGHSLTSLGSVLNGQNVVTQLAKVLDDRQREILVGVEVGQSGFLVFANLLFNLVQMCAGKGPRVRQIFSAQSRVAAQ